MHEIALSFSGLGHSYFPGQWVFRNYGGEIPRGQVFALLGRNGSGKTTLLRCLLGTLKPTEGEIHLAGRTAFVPQLFQVSFDYTALDMVLMGRAKHVGLFSQPSKADEDASLAALERFHMAKYAARPFQELSGGERQLIIFARALVAKAEILILDEPTSALDLSNQALILSWIDRLCHEDGMTVVFATHHPHHAFAAADNALLMNGNGEYRSGPVQTVLTELNLEELYGIPLKKLSFEHAGKAVETFVPVF